MFEIFLHFRDDHFFNFRMWLLHINAKLGNTFTDYFLDINFIYFKTSTFPIKISLVYELLHIMNGKIQPNFSILTYVKISSLKTLNFMSDF